MFSDFQMHVIGVPQIAPEFGAGKGNVIFDGPRQDEDFGLEQVTGNYSSQVSQNVYIKGVQVVIEASAGLTLKVGGSFVTVDPSPEATLCSVWIEDDGCGIPEEQRGDLFNRGARLDTNKPGTGLGLAIVRDVAQIYGGTVELDESEDLGGLLVRLKLPRAPVAALA